MAKDAQPMETAIIIKTDATLGTIDDNFAELKVAVAKKVMKYQGLIFADEDIKDAKSTKSELSSMINTIETSRKAIKKKWNDPYMDFEKRVKEVVALIEKPMIDIDVQIKDFEERRKIKKEAEVRLQKTKLLSAVSEEHQAFVLGCGIAWDERWLNATMTMNKVTEDIQGQIDHIISEVTSLQDICEGDEMLPDLLGVYMTTKDLASSLQKRKTIMAERETVRKMQEAAAARKQAAIEAEAERQRVLEEEARLRKEEEDRELVIKADDTPVIEDLKYSDDDEWEDEEDDEEAGNVQNVQAAPSSQMKQSTLFRVTFAVDGDMDTMQILVDFMNTKNIIFKRVSQQKIS